MALCIASGEAIVENKAAGISTMTLKNGIGVTGVELRWYPRKEYATLSDEQKNVLKEFKNTDAQKK